MHQSRAGLHRAGVVANVGGVDELGFPGEIDVIGARTGARGDERFAVERVRPDSRDEDAGALGDGAHGGRVGDIGAQQRQVRQPGVDRSEPIADGLQLGRVAPGERPAAVGRCVPRQVLGRQLAGESGRAEQDDVIAALCHICAT